METMSPSSTSVSARQEALSLEDENSLLQTLVLSDSLKDLKNLRTQLYSAAEYFEVSYTNDDRKEIVVNTLKDYAVKALVNAVDHLGSVSYKVDDFLDEKFDEVSGTELRISCIEQRIRTCQEYIDHQGFSQQTLMIKTPKYHKHYILPGESMFESGRQAAAVYQDMDQIKEDHKSNQLQAAIRMTIRNRRSSVSKSHSPSPSPSPRARSSSPSYSKMSLPTPSLKNGKFFSTEKKRASSPVPMSNPFARSGSFSSRTNVHNSSSGKQYPAEPQKLVSMRLHAERTETKEFENNTSKNKSLLKSLLSRRKPRNDEMLYTYLDEY